jgi:hypothetical protein
MGKSTTYVGTSISPLLDGSAIPSTSKQATFSHIMSNNGISLSGSSLAEALVKARQGNLPNKYRNATNWVESINDPYEYGSVRGYLEGSKSNSYIKSIIENQLETDLGYPIAIDYCLYDTVNNYHMTWFKLISTYGYVANTNQLDTLTSFIGKPCYLYGALVAYCTNTVANNAHELLDPIGLAFDHGQTQSRTRDETRVVTDWVEQTVADKDLLFIQYTYRIVETKVTTLGITTTSTDIVPPTDYISKVETVGSDSTALGIRTVITNQDYVVEITEDFLLYEWSGTIPDTELGSNTIDPNAVYIPNSNPWAEPSKYYYQVSYTYSGGRNYFTYEMGKGTNTTLDNLFTDGGEFGKYTPRLYCRLGGTKLNQDSLSTTKGYKDSVKLSKKLGLDWSSMTDQIHTAIGDLEYVRDIYITMGVPIVDATPLQLRYLFDWFNKSYSNSGVLEPSTYRKPNGTSLTYNMGEYVKTINPRLGKSIYYTDDVYSGSMGFTCIGKTTTVGSIGLVGTLVQTYEYILGRGEVVNSESKANVILISKQITNTTYESIHIVEPVTTQNVSGVWAGSTVEDKNILLPMDTSFKSLFQPDELEKFYNECLYVVVNTSQTVKEKWYESDWFKALTFVVAVVLALPSGGQSLNLWSVIYAAISVIGLQVTLSLLLEVIVDVFDLDIKEILFLVIVTAAYTGDFSSLRTSAMTLLKAVNTGLEMSMEAMKNTYEDMLKEMEAFQDLTEQQDDKLKEANAQLASIGYLFDPLYTTTNTNRYFYTLGDNPSDYINRTIHSGNVGSLVFKSVSDYASIMLKLPDTKTTLSKYNLT